MRRLDGCRPAARWRTAAGITARLAFGLASVGLASVGHGQQPPRIVPLQGEGQVDSASQEGVVAVIGGNIYLIAPGPGALVTVQGPASRECLVPGTPVGFEVALDDKGKPTGEVERVWLHASGPAGIHPQDEPPAKKPSRRRVAGIHNVVGVVKGTMPTGEYTILAGTERLAVKLKEDVTVELNSANLALASKGDTLVVSGSYMQPDIQPGQPVPPLQAEATRLTVTLAKPFDPHAGKKRPVKPPARKQPAPAGG